MNEIPFPKCSFCIKLTNEQVIKILDIFDKQNVPYYYIYNWGAVTCNCNSEKEAKYILEVQDEGPDAGKNWLATSDYLRTSKDGVFVKLITPDNPDNNKPMPEFKDVFKIFEVTDEYLNDKSEKQDD